jgi:hypothetical protein
VDRLALLQEALDHTNAAADHYRIGDCIVEVQAKDVFTGDNRTKHGWIAGALQRIILQIAEDHADECDQDTCRTCVGIRSGLAVSLVALQDLRAEEMEQWFSAGTARS